MLALVCHDPVAPPVPINANRGKVNIGLLYALTKFSSGNRLVLRCKGCQGNAEFQHNPVYQCSWSIATQITDTGEK